VAQPSPNLGGAVRRRLRSFKPGFGGDPRRHRVRVGARAKACFLQQVAPARDGVVPYVRRVAQRLELVDERVERWVIRRVVVDEHEASTATEHARQLAERRCGVGEVMRGESTRRQVERRIREGERGRVGLNKCGVRRADDAGAPRLHHLERRVRADRERDHWSDAPQGVAHAAAQVEGTLAAPGRSDGEETLEILTGCVRRTRHVCSGRLAELHAYVFHSSLSSTSPYCVFVRVGRFQVEIFSDGIFRLDGGLMYGIVAKPLWEKEQPADERNRVALEMNCLLIRDGTGNVVVVETGAGPKLTERSKQNFGIAEPPRLLDELARRGVRPDEVTLVVNTHLHFDHAGGNTYSDGGKIVATFPRASYVFQRLEWVDANVPNERTRGSYFVDDFAPLEAAGKLELID
jgi:hypothetical protein